VLEVALNPMIVTIKLRRRQEISTVFRSVYYLMTTNDGKIVEMYYELACS